MAVRIAGVLIPEQKKVKVALTYIFGIGHTTSGKILGRVGIDPEKRTRELEEMEVLKLKEDIEKHYQVEGDLRRVIGLNIKRMKEVNCYRGIRHKQGLPVHGQRTKTNARTKRGRRVSAGSGKKKLTKV